MTVKTQVKIQRWCRWCFHEWWELVGRKELRLIAAGEFVGECPNCHQPT